MASYVIKAKLNVEELNVYSDIFLKKIPASRYELPEYYHICFCLVRYMVFNVLKQFLFISFGNKIVSMKIMKSQ